MRVNTSFGELFVYTGAREHQTNQPAVVFVHGTGMDHTVWVLPSRYFARHGYNVLSLDLPGHGKSAGSPCSTIDEMADAVVETMEAAGISSAALVGHSMGSLVTLSAAARHPDRARALALIGTTAPMGVHPAMMASAANNDHDVIDMITYWGYSKSAQLGGNENPGMWMAGTTLRLLEKARDDVIHYDLKACEGYATGQDHARAIQCPTLFILGDRDIMTPMRSAQKMIDAIPDAKVCRMQKTGHSLMMERPDALLDALITIV
ncbi:MAG: alpha/beta fold hydrolase [Arenicellales bacterium]|nr:alpha/beta hydrolase [Gammaproteobacteria bacterium]